MGKKKTTRRAAGSLDTNETSFHLTGTAASVTSPTQLRVIPFETDNFYAVVQQVCNGMLIGGYRLSASHTEGDERLVLFFQR